MKYLALIVLVLFVACENSKKKDTSTSVTQESTKKMETFVDENSILTVGDTTQIWVKRVFTDGEFDAVVTIGRGGKERVYEYNGIASLNLFDCKQKLHIVEEMYYFNRDNPVYEVDNRPQRIEDKTQWDKIEPGGYIEKIYQLVCKPATEEK